METRLVYLVFFVVKGLEVKLALQAYCPTFFWEVPFTLLSFFFQFGVLLTFSLRP